jgi:hypothetical protein
MKNLFLALVLILSTSGCAKVKTLETINADLVSQKETLEEKNYYLCAWLLEAQTMGMVAYIGDGNFYNGMSQEIESYDELGNDCDAALTGYMESMPLRQDTVQAMLDKRKDE